MRSFKLAVRCVAACALLAALLLALPGCDRDKLFPAFDTDKNPSGPLLGPAGAPYTYANFVANSSSARDSWNPYKFDP
jgi:hypothetical protein